jgi:hypothetical protein
VIERLQASPVFSARRLAATFTLVFLVSLVAWQLDGVLRIAGPREVAANTLIHGVGAYVGITVADMVITSRDGDD